MEQHGVAILAEQKLMSFEGFRYAMDGWLQGTGKMSVHSMSVQCGMKTEDV